MSVRTPSRVVAIDWSGAGQDAKRRLPGIWMAIWSELGGVELEGRLSRNEVIERLISQAATDRGLVAGFDFSFSFPAWFVQRLGGSAEAAWRAAEADGERWLKEAAYPFWRVRRPTYSEGEPEYRATELELGGGRRPSSTFKLVGDGQVGTGSVRGMPGLLRLQTAGFAVWPFQPAAFPLALEIYPTACYPPGTRASETRRLAWLDGLEEFFSAAQRATAAVSPDAFDAAAALAAMVRGRESFACLPAARNEQESLEGRIWTHAPPRSAIL